MLLKPRLPGEKRVGYGERKPNELHYGTCKSKARKDEREIYEQECRKQREETHELFFASTISVNGFENESEYSSYLISEDELTEISKQLDDYYENDRRIRRDIDRLKKETADKEKPDLEKLKYDFNDIKTASDALCSERDETKLRLDNKCGF
jgi:hypothetical protein